MALAGLLGGLLLAGGLAWWLRPAPPLPTPPGLEGEVNSAARIPATPPPQAVPSAAPVVMTRAPMSAPVSAPLPTPTVMPSAATTAPSTAPESSAAPAPISESASETHLGPLAGDLAVADLAPPMRGGLPPLRLSMHVFAEDAARRFAIVDGARLREGEALAEGLQVLEIRRDGLRLAWQGRVLWLPR